MTMASGTRLGPYEILAPLGAGGMGEVYRAHDSRLDRTVAIKVLPAAFSRDAERLRRFEQEARATAALNHPNILAVFDIGTHEDSPYVVTELLEGETLRHRIQSGPLSVRKATDYALQAARGIAAAHDRGIVHRDLKPENIFLTRDGRIKILDFGLAKLTRPHGESSGADTPTLASQTEPGLVLGTVGYMSPEQVRGKPADARSDIFSLGAILYEMVSGKRAFTTIPLPIL
jgi:serine/threonine protein kinase